MRKGGGENAQGIYVILKQKSKQKFQVKVTEKQRVFIEKQFDRGEIL